MQPEVSEANHTVEVRVLLPDCCLATGTAAPVIQSMEDPGGIYMGRGNEK